MKFSLLIITESVCSSKLTVTINHGLQCRAEGLCVCEGWWQDMWKREAWGEKLESGPPNFSCSSQQLACFFPLLLSVIPISFSLSWISGGQKFHPPLCLCVKWACWCFTVCKRKKKSPRNKIEQVLFCLSVPRGSFPQPVISSGSGEELPVPPVSKGNLFRATVALLG